MLEKPDSSQQVSRTSQGPQRSLASHEAILDAAEALLREHGPAGLTFEAVARRAQAGKPTIYRWWPNKTALLHEICTKRKTGRIEMPDLGSLRQDLIEYTRNLWRYWRETDAGVAFAALIAEAQHSDEGRAVLAQSYMEREDGPSLPAFERARARGEIADDVTVSHMREAYVATNWFHLLCGKLDDTAVAPAIDALLLGMLARPNARRETENRRENPTSKNP